MQNALSDMSKKDYVYNCKKRKKKKLCERDRANFLTVLADSQYKKVRLN